jgi:hypothetical protein
MSNKIKEEINKINIPKELHERSEMGILKAKNEKQRSRKKYNVKVVIVAASLLVSIGTIFLFNNFFIQNGTTPNQNTLVVMKDGSVVIPMIQLPENTSTAAMIGLIVYNGKIYTQTRTEIEAEQGHTILGEKLGTTKETIDEWSKQEAYDEDFASTIGKADVYSVKGYDKDFRIMTYEEREGKFYAEFYECINGITINDGEDVFGKLKMIGNVSTAQYRIFSDWDNSINNHRSISDMNVLNSFVEKLIKAKPFPREINSDPLGDSRNDEEFRELTVHLNDGTKVSLTLLKGGYIYYGHMSVYFKMDENEFLKMWDQLQ